MAAPPMVTTPPPALDSTVTPASDPTTCSLHIRLFDGTSVKARFASTATLAGAVRPFISATATASPGGGPLDLPYDFRLLALPLRSRTLEMSEETRGLVDLGLWPSATLALVPVRDYAGAYAAGEPGEVVRRGLSRGFACAAEWVDRLGGMVERFMAPKVGERVVGVSDAVDEREEPRGDLYNGNHLSVAPNVEEK